jgi:hypothetical protein
MKENKKGSSFPSRLFRFGIAKESPPQEPSCATAFACLLIFVLTAAFLPM